MKILITSLLLFASLSLSAQRFYVEGKDNKSVDKIAEKIRYEGYTVLSDSTNADYIIQLLLDGHYKVVTMKRPYHGYLRIVNNKDGAEIGRTRDVKGSPTAFNGYNASYSIFTKISEKYLKDLLAKCKPQ